MSTRCLKVISKWRTNNASCAVADLIVLAFGQLNHKLGDLVFDLHLAKDRRAIVGHGNVPVGRDQDLVQSARAKRRPQNARYRTRNQNMTLIKI